ncbi:MAG TPA: ATP-binding protein [Ohtaekwangia sp.]|uniref:sensor histidine kinase n=1 Tax=Ohtaekwangia sp. TaxID=2066019 RepID=UPI002F952639
MSDITINPSMKLLVDTVQELSLARDLETVMRIVRTAARKLTGADGATFVLRDGNFCFYADEDAIGPLWKGSRFPISICISGWAMLNKKAAVIEDIYVDDRIPVDVYRPTFVKSLAMVPIRTINPIGAIGNYWAEQHIPSEEEVTLLQSLADITAVTLENVNVYSELEQRVKDRTQQVESANKELQIVNKELESFSYSVSHDLRAPLRAIMGFTKMLEEDYEKVLDDEGKRILGVIQRNAGKMDNLINDLLKFSRLGRKEIQKTSIDTLKLVQSTLHELNTSIAHRAIIQIDALLPSYADYTLLGQVWTNLLSNAIKYSSKKENPLIEIGSYKKDSEHIYFVKDNGTGFDMAYADKLFGVFQRLHKPSDFEGTGVGLALVQRITARHGGSVWAEATVNEGATFYFSLPAE